MALSLTSSGKTQNRSAPKLYLAFDDKTGNLQLLLLPEDFRLKKEASTEQVASFPLVSHEPMQKEEIVLVTTAIYLATD
jgi:hypothetical protein